MWPWTKREPPTDLRELTQLLKDVQADVRRLEVEWTDMYDKLVTRDARLRKREERAAPAPEPVPSIPTMAERKAALRARLAAQRAS